VLAEGREGATHPLSPLGRDETPQEIHEPRMVLHELARGAGLAGGHVVERSDGFSGTSASEKVSADLHLHSVNFYAAKPA
jgi:hypothetical protein